MAFGAKFISNGQAIEIDWPWNSCPLDLFLCVLLILQFMDFSLSSRLKNIKSFLLSGRA